jgi:hypothetical protein
MAYRSIASDYAACKRRIQSLDLRRGEEEPEAKLKEATLDSRP